MKKLDSMKIDYIEKKAKELRDQSRQRDVEFIEILNYLRVTKRYRENPKYAKVSFWVYTEEVFMIREKTYRERSKAYNMYPEYSVKYGVGLVSKIQRKFGAKKDVQKVFGQIDKLKDPRRDQIEKVIEKNMPETKRITKTNTDWRAMYEAEKSAHEQTREMLRAAEKENASLRKRIDRLTKAASKYDKVQKIIEAKEDVFSYV